VIDHGDAVVAVGNNCSNNTRSDILDIHDDMFLIIGYLFVKKYQLHTAFLTDLDYTKIIYSFGRMVFDRVRVE
jgi:hypothetical protein